jgi:suppressor of ftsI
VELFSTDFPLLLFSYTMSKFRYLFVLTLGMFLLAACSQQVNDPSNMTMDHSQMNHGMMRPDQVIDVGSTSTLLSGKDIDLSSLSEAKTPQTIDVSEGKTIDLNPQIVKKTINGKTFAFYGYNGQFPGPMLRAEQGTTFTVRVKNEIDQPTSIHWHGLRLDSKSDGTVGLVQEAIEPGNSFTYTVTVPDEGIFWYHPHVREDVQQDLGLYGNILVTPKIKTAYASVNGEQALFLDDILLGENGLPVSYGREDADHALMGRFGNAMLINGEIDPPLPAVKKGDTVRFYLTNAANTRTFKLAFTKAKMKLVGGDNGRFMKEQFVDSIVLAPSERVIIDVLFSEDGTIFLQNLEPRTQNLALFTVSAEGTSQSYETEFNTLRGNADVASDIEAFKPFFGKEPDYTVELSVEAKLMAGMNHQGMMSESPDGIEWEDTMPHMNTVSTKANTQWKLIDAASKKENMKIDYAFRKGEKVKIRLVNDENSAHPMQHPIHFHGQRFLVISDNGVENTNLIWKDTVLVPAGRTVDILLDASNPGDWMFHCHIAEHLTNGMMGIFRVSQS